MSRLSVVVLLCLAAALLLAPAAHGAVPRGFFGVNVNGPLDEPAFDLDAEAATMHANGVRSWRIEFSWDLLEPEPGRFDWSRTDRKVLAAARARIDVLGLAVRAPAWANGGDLDPFVPPRDPAAYGAFMTALIARYGPAGSLWAEHPEVPRRPVRAWEIWNEPNLAIYFRAQPFARPYARLLRAASRAVRRADRRATIVLAGMANFSWRDLDRFLRVERDLDFDAAAVHPFTGRPSGMVEIVRRNRATLARRGHARTPVWLTELTWSSAKGRKEPLTKGWETTEAGQAQRLTQAFRLLVRERRRLRIGRVLWYTWASADNGSANSFEYSGLRTTRGGTTLRDKPALRAFRDATRRHGG